MNVSEDMWLVSHAARSFGVRKLRGAIALLFVDLLDRMFGDKRPSFRTGIFLPFKRGPKAIFATLKIMIADGDALKAMYGSKGATGKMPCLE